MTAITYERLDRARQNLTASKALLDHIDIQRHYSTMVGDLEAIARESPAKAEREEMLHKIRQYRSLVPEIGYEEAYSFIFEQGLKVR
jgi:hypothetical protein